MWKSRWPPWLLSQIVLIVSVDVKQHSANPVSELRNCVKGEVAALAPVPNPYGLCGRPLTGGLGCLMSASCLESQGCHLIPFLSFPPLLFCFSFLPSPFALSVWIVIFLLMVHFPFFFSFFFLSRKHKYFLLRVMLDCMALVEQLGDDSW